MVISKDAETSSMGMVVEEVRRDCGDAAVSGRGTESQGS